MPQREIDQKELDKFATQQIYWWGGERTGVELDHILVTILAKKPKLEAEIREKFALTDDDFRRALKNAAPGVFWGVAAEKRWEAANRRFGIEPPLPFPVIDWGARLGTMTSYKCHDCGKTIAPDRGLRFFTREENADPEEGYLCEPCADRRLEEEGKK